MGRREALLRVVCPKSSFTAIGVNGAGLSSLTSCASTPYLTRFSSFSLVAVVFIKRERAYQRRMVRGQAHADKASHREASKMARRGVQSA